MMIGFVMLTRLDMTLAVKQFLIAVASVAFSLTVPVIVEKVGFFEQARYCLRHYRSRSCWFRIYFWYKGLWCDQLDQHCGYWFSAIRISKIIFVFFVAAMLLKTPV